MGRPRPCSHAAGGPERRKVLKYIAVELGIMDKLVAVLYERQFRPKEKWHRPWIDACDTQIRDGFKWVDNEINTHGWSATR